MLSIPVLKGLALGKLGFLGKIGLIGIFGILALISNCNNHYCSSCIILPFEGKKVE